MKKEIVQKDEFNEVTDLSPLSKILHTEEAKFVTVTPEKLAIIERKMGEVNRAVRSFSKQNTQTDIKLRTLTMMSVNAPYRTIRQILAQVDTKRAALQEAYFNILEKKEEIKDYNSQDTDLAKIKAAKLQCEINSSNTSIEASLKEIGALLQVYEEIKESHNIPDKWDEVDMETEEIAHNIKAAFRNGIRDMVSTGRLGMGTQEWFEQFGIGPLQAMQDIGGYLDRKRYDYDTMMEFLDSMAVKYEDNYKLVMKRLGIKTLIDEEWIYKEV